MGGNGKIGVPLVNDAGKEKLFIENKWQNVPIGGLLFKQRLATIFSLQGKPDILLKYEINCDTPKEIHPLLKEAIILTLTSKSRISPKLHYLSGPVKFTYPPTSWKTQIDSTKARLETCARTGGSVRVIAMENAGISVYDLTRTGDEARIEKAKKKWVQQCVSRRFADARSYTNCS